jgi:BirA family biotin operon repressor/biotin-[acetyl-CoA-carboxylase] ligase
VSTDRHIDRLLGLLVDHPMVILSGAKMAREIGVSRWAVWRWVGRLRALGVRIKGHPRTGYQLERVPDILIPEILRRRLAGTHFGKRLHHYFKIDSTNRVALELAASGEPHGTLVVAEEQTAGRGRLGRTWYSEKTSGIYVSFLVRPDAPPGRAPLAPQQAVLLTLAAGLAARDAVVDSTGLPVDLRWPNDLLLAGRKFCGILTEMVGEADRLHYVVVGVGINVNHTQLPRELEDQATSLRLAGGRAYSRLEILVRLLERFDHYYNRLRADGPEPLIERFGEVSSWARNKPVRVAAGEEFEGVTVGLDSTGLLLVRRTDGTIVPVLAGDVREA